MAELGDLDRNGSIALVGGIVTLVAAFLPWVSTGSIGLNSFAAMVIGLVGIGVVVGRDWDRGDRISAAGAGVLGTLWAVFRLVDPAGPAGTPAGDVVDVSPGVGVYLALVGGILLVVGGVLALRG